MQRCLCRDASAHFSRTRGMRFLLSKLDLFELASQQQFVLPKNLFTYKLIVELRKSQVLIWLFFVLHTARSREETSE